MRCSKRSTARREDVCFAEVGERLGEEVELFLHGRRRFGDRLDQRGEILRGEEIGVGTAQAEVRLDQLHFAQRVHLAGARGLVKKIAEVEKIERPGERAFGPRGALGHEGEPSRLLREAAHDEARIAERHSPDDEASDGLGLAHELRLDRINKINRIRKAD